MNTLIKIDLRTLRKNPYYGYREFVPGATRTSFTATELPKFFKDGINCIITEIKADPIQYFGEIIDQKLVVRCINEKPKCVSLSISREVIEVTSNNQPEYFFKYLPTKIKCEECHNSFLHTELKSDSYFDGDDDIWSNEICPICGEWHCCHIKYESVEDALKRKKVKL